MIPPAPRADGVRCQLLPPLIPPAPRRCGNGLSLRCVQHILVRLKTRLSRTHWDRRFLCARVRNGERRCGKRGSSCPLAPMADRNVSGKASSAVSRKAGGKPPPRRRGLRSRSGGSNWLLALPARQQLHPNAVWLSKVCHMDAVSVCYNLGYYGGGEVCS